jgi:hypothetical protein
LLLFADYRRIVKENVKKMKDKDDIEIGEKGILKMEELEVCK